MDREDDGDTGGKGDLAEDGVREGSGGVGESGVTMAEDDGVAGGRGIIDGVGEDGGGIVDGVGGCGIGKAEDNGRWKATMMLGWMKEQKARQGKWMD